MIYPSLPHNDLDRMFFGLSEPDWLFFSHKRLFVTGGSGFIGKWLLNALLTANKRLDLKCKIEILTRSPKKFRDEMPQVANGEGVVLHQGDVRNFDFPKGEFDIIVHGATDVVARNDPLEMFSTCFDGTRRVLEFAKLSGAQDFLLTSSGAVYGKHPSTPTGLTESYMGGPDLTLTSSAYGEGKRVSEWLAFTMGEKMGLKVKVARIYAQVGPYLPMDKHFAIGNFIKDALEKRQIRIRGDGRAYRSYLYAADTAIWLWSMIVRGRSGRAWNVGGDEGLSIADLALRVNELLGSDKGIKIITATDPSLSVDCYVADTSRAKNELSLPVPYSLDEAIVLTAEWYKKFFIL